MKQRSMLATAGLVLALLLAGCGGSGNSGTGATIGGPTADTGGSDMKAGSGTGDGSGSDASTNPGGVTATAGGESGTATASNATPISISADPSANKFSQGVMQAPAGSPLQINFLNPAQKEHNWVLVKEGQEQAVVDAAKNNSDLSQVEGVIAWSKPVANGSATIDVPPLEQGGYKYISTVPGDYPEMQGALNVR